MNSLSIRFRVVSSLRLSPLPMRSGIITKFSMPFRFHTVYFEPPLPLFLYGGIFVPLICSRILLSMFFVSPYIAYLPSKIQGFKVSLFNINLFGHAACREATNKIRRTAAAVQRELRRGGVAAWWAGAMAALPVRVGGRGSPPLLPVSGEGFYRH